MNHRTRQIVCTGHAREDSLYDIETRMTDTKGQRAQLLLKLLPAGNARHDMWLAITVDEAGNPAANLQTTLRPWRRLGVRYNGAILHRSSDVPGIGGTSNGKRTRICRNVQISPMRTGPKRKMPPVSLPA